MRLATLATAAVIAETLPRHAPTLVVIGPVLALRALLAPTQQIQPMTAVYEPRPRAATA